MVNKIQVELIEKKLYVYIKELLHFYIKTDNLIGIQSYIDDTKDNLYWIDYIFDNGTIITSEYTYEEDWKEILKQLDKYV